MDILINMMGDSTEICSDDAFLVPTTQEHVVSGRIRSVESVADDSHCPTIADVTKALQLIAHNDDSDDQNHREQCFRSQNFQLDAPEIQILAKSFETVKRVIEGKLFQIC